MKQYVLYGACGLIVLSLLCLLYVLHVRSGTMVRTQDPQSTQQSTKGMVFETAISAEEQSRGLGGRAMIADNYGMLFVFAKDGTPGFWMKDMLQPIDMIWLTDKGTIVKVDASVATSTFPSVFYPPVPVRYVLETRAGLASAKQWVIGTTLQLPPPYSSQTDKSVSK